MNALPSHIDIGQFSLVLASNLPLVFFLSGMLRLTVSASLLGGFHEARAVEAAPFTQLVCELPLLKPLAQFLGGPLRVGK